MCEKNGIQVIEAEGFQDHERLEACRIALCHVQLVNVLAQNQASILLIGASKFRASL